MGPSLNVSQAMNNTNATPDLRQTLDALEALTEEAMPAGWSRRNWVQREALALGALGESLAFTRREPAAE